MLCCRLQRQFIVLPFPVSRTVLITLGPWPLPHVQGQWDKNASLAVFLLAPSHDSHSCHQISVSLPLRRMHVIMLCTQKTKIPGSKPTNWEANRIGIYFFSFIYLPRYLYLKVSSLIQKTLLPACKRKLQKCQYHLVPQQGNSLYSHSFDKN